jgi:hypothetical protein
VLCRSLMVSEALGRDPYRWDLVRLSGLPLVFGIHRNPHHERSREGEVGRGCEPPGERKGEREKEGRSYLWDP